MKKKHEISIKTVAIFAGICLAVLVVVLGIVIFSMHQHKKQLVIAPAYETESRQGDEHLVTQDDLDPLNPNGNAVMDEEASEFVDSETPQQSTKKQKTKKLKDIVDPADHDYTRLGTEIMESKEFLKLLLDVDCYAGAGITMKDFEGKNGGILYRYDIENTDMSFKVLMKNNKLTTDGCYNRIDKSYPALFFISGIPKNSLSLYKAVKKDKLHGCFLVTTEKDKFIVSSFEPDGSLPTIYTYLISKDGVYRKHA